MRFVFLMCDFFSSFLDSLMENSLQDYWNENSYTAAGKSAGSKLVNKNSNQKPIAEQFPVMGKIVSIFKYSIYI